MRRSRGGLTSLGRGGREGEDDVEIRDRHQLDRACSEHQRPLSPIGRFTLEIARRMGARSAEAKDAPKRILVGLAHDGTAIKGRVLPRVGITADR